MLYVAGLIPSLMLAAFASVELHAVMAAMLGGIR